MMQKPLLLCLFISLCVHLTVCLGLQHVLTLEPPAPEKEPLLIRAMPPSQASASSLLEKLPAGPLSTALGRTLPVKQHTYPEINETALFSLPSQPAFKDLSQAPEQVDMPSTPPAETFSYKQLKAELLLAARQSPGLGPETLPLEFPVQPRFEDESPAARQDVPELSPEPSDLEAAEAKLLEAPKRPLQHVQMSTPSQPEFKDLHQAPEQVVDLPTVPAGKTFSPRQLEAELLLAARQSLGPGPELLPLRLSEPVNALSDDPAVRFRGKPQRLKPHDLEPEPAHAAAKNDRKLVGALRPGTRFDLPAPEIVDRSRTNPALPQPKALLFSSIHTLGSEQLFKTRSTGKQMSVLQDMQPPALTMKPFPDPGPQISALSIKQTAAVPLPLSNFPKQDQHQGATFSFVLDTSGTVKGAPLFGIKTAASELIKLLDDTDSVTVLTFDDEVRTLADFSRKKSKVLGQVAELKTSGKNTLLFEALLQALEDIENRDQAKKFILLFSDGKDEGSTATLDQVIEKARQARVPIFSIGYSKIEKTFLANLDELASKTGGSFVFMPQFKELLTVFKIQNLLLKTKRNPENPNIFFNLGLLYYRLKNYRQAEMMFSRVAALKPEYLDQGLYNLAMVQKKQGKLEECIQNLHKAQAANPDNSRVKAALKKLTQDHGPAEQTARRQAEKLTRQAREESNTEKAKAMLEEAIALNPEHIQTWRQLGNKYMELQDYKKSGKVFEKVLALGVQDPEIFFNLGYVYTLDGQYAYAEQMYSRVLHFKPSYLDEAYFNLAYVQNKQGKLDESVANLKQALKINPDNKSARKLLQNIISNR